MRFVLLKLIALYRIFLAPLIGGQCRFYPSCSQYAQEALKQHNHWRAMTLTLKRLLRCQPWQAGGIDLVP